MKPLRNLVQQGVDFLSPNQFRQPFPGDAFRSEMSAQHHADQHPAGGAVTPCHDRLNKRLLQVVFVFCDEVDHPREHSLSESGLTEGRYQSDTLFML